MHLTPQQGNREPARGHEREKAPGEDTINIDLIKEGETAAVKRDDFVTKCSINGKTESKGNYFDI